MGAHRPRRVSLLGKKGEFATGLIRRVLKKFPQAKVIDNRKKPMGSPTPFLLNLYPAQAEAVKQALLKGRGCISMPTGTGKSRVIDAIASRLGLKTLVVVPSVEIKKQLEATVTCKNITVMNIDSPKLKTLTNFDCLIIDEAHHVAAKTYQRLNKTAWPCIYHRFFLTATPFRNNQEETLLFEAIAGDLIYRLTYREAIKEGYIVPVEAYFIEVPKQETNAYTYAQVYKELVTSNVVRNLMISNLILTLEDSAVLTLVKEVAHGQTLSDMTRVAFVSGQDEESRDYIRHFNSGGIKSLIGTTGILGEGVDSKPAEYVIIAGLGKAKSQFMQQVGRAVRKYPGKESAKIFLILDRSHKFTLRHFREQARILKEEYGIVPIKIEI